MAEPISRFVPRRPLGTRLNWSGDPLFGRDKETITAGQAKTGLAYNQALAAPGSPQMAALFRPATRPAGSSIPTGWVKPSAPSRPGDYVSRYGTASLRMFPGAEAKAGIAKLQTANPFNPELPNPNIPTETVAQVDAGSAGPVGNEDPVNPALEAPDPVDSPNLDAAPVASPVASAPADAMSDNDFASSALAEMDAIMAGLDGGYAPTAPASADAPMMDDVNPDYQSPISARPADRSWMFTPREERAPVQFNNTNAQWGTSLDMPATSRGPAPSTINFYQRALDRARGGSKADVRRVNRLGMRFNTRPTNG